MNRKVYLLVTIGLILTSLLAACQPREVIKTVEVEKIVTKEVVKTVEVEVQATSVAQVGGFTSMASLAEAIRSGEIDVGDEYGMGLDQRFHTIHVTTIAMNCTRCHVQEAPEEVAPAAEGAPGQVDRRVCLGCHLNGPALTLYEPKE